MVWGDSTAFTPPHRAVSLSRSRRLFTPRWMATSDDEHAVSMLMQGPLKPNV